MKTEDEIKKEVKRVRYERVKKEPICNESFLEGYYVALRWVQGKAKSIFDER
jgi:hypothetical protein